MKSNTRFILTAASSLLVTVLLGCASVKEMGKGFVGVSTQVLEDYRKDAVKKSFVLSYNDCYTKVKGILFPKDKLDTGAAMPYIYSEDLKKKMLAIYVSQSDTTPVGIFFTEEAGGSTLIEISSPSTYAREEIANRIFTGIIILLKPKVEPQDNSLITNNQSQEEKKADVEKKSDN